MESEPIGCCVVNVAQSSAKQAQNLFCFITHSSIVK